MSLFIHPDQWMWYWFKAHHHVPAVQYYCSAWIMVSLIHGSYWEPKTVTEVFVKGYFTGFQSFSHSCSVGETNWIPGVPSAYHNLTQNTIVDIEDDRLLPVHKHLMPNRSK